MATSKIKAPSISGIGELLGTTDGAIYSGSPRTIIFDSSGYSLLLVVVTSARDPESSTWLSTALFPINIEDLHGSPAKTAMIFTSGGGSTHCDIRIEISKTQLYAVLDSKSSSLDPYVSVYGIK